MLGILILRSKKIILELLERDYTAVFMQGITKPADPSSTVGRSKKKLD